MSLTELKGAAKRLGLSAVGNKQSLKNRLKDAIEDEGSEDEEEFEEERHEERRRNKRCTRSDATDAITQKFTAFTIKDVEDSLSHFLSLIQNRGYPSFFEPEIR